MTEITLYTGGGVSLSPIYADGRRKSAYVRLVADDGKTLQKGEIVSTCVDVLADDVSNWMEIDAPSQEDELTDDEALTRYANKLTGATDETLTEATETLIKIAMEGR